MIAHGTSVEAELLGAFNELLIPVSILIFPALYLCTCNPAVLVLWETEARGL